MIAICATAGTIAGGYVPVLWGASAFSLVSLLFSGVGGAAGIWLGARLQP